MQVDTSYTHTLPPPAHYTRRSARLSSPSASPSRPSSPQPGPSTSRQAVSYTLASSSAAGGKRKASEEGDGGGLVVEAERRAEARSGASPPAGAKAGAKGKGKLVEVDCESAAAPSSASSASLPGLLSHLDLNGTFPVTADSLSPDQLAAAFPPLASPSVLRSPPPSRTIPTSGLSAWRLWGSAVAYPPSPNPATPSAPPPHHHPLHHPTSSPLKRDSPPSPHLIERTKQRKVSHRFLRSEQLLAPPPPAPRKLAPAAPAAPTRPGFLRARDRTESDDVVSLALTRSTGTLMRKRRVPAWWASVSRTFGDGMPSRLGPKENVWVGDGRAWLPALRPKKAKDEDKPFAVPPRHHLPLPRHPTAPLDENLVPPTPTEDAASAKKQLLAVLRRRLADSGGASGVGQAALRFRRWVIWNKHFKDQGGYSSARFVEDEEEDEDGEGEGEQREREIDPAEMDRELGLASYKEVVQVEEHDQKSEGRVRNAAEAAVEVQVQA